MMQRAPSSRSSTVQRRHTVAALALIALAAAVPVLMAPAGHGAGAAIDRCGIPPELVSLGAPLPHTAARLEAGRTLTIVALGSSSTEGAGATRPDRSYPSRLAAVLQKRFPAVPIRVINRGVGGEMTREMAARIDRDVLPENPDLVIWQLGTNGVLHGIDTELEMQEARQGIERIKAHGADVMLMDLQFAPAVLVHVGFREMEHALSSVARSEDVPLFHRFAVMRHWAEEGQMTLPVMLAVDRLHMSDVSYDCLAQQIARSIAETVRDHS